jgi:hypothetical protein
MCGAAPELVSSSAHTFAVCQTTDRLWWLLASESGDWSPVGPLLRLHVAVPQLQQPVVEQEGTVEFSMNCVTCQYILHQGSTPVQTSVIVTLKVQTAV